MIQRYQRLILRHNSKMLKYYYKISQLHKFEHQMYYDKYKHLIERLVRLDMYRGKYNRFIVNTKHSVVLDRKEKVKDV